MGENGSRGSREPDGLEGAMRAAFRDDRTALRGESILAVLDASGEAAPRRVLRDIDSESTPVLSSVPADETPPSSRYQLVGEIAHGGMGVILKGRDTDLCRDVAVKVLKPSHAGQPELIKRFVEEAQIGGQLQHPGIVPVYDVGLHPDGRPWFTMKLVKGRTLAALLDERENPAKDRQRFLGIFEQACQTIAYAHARGVLHRDLKPSNVMVGSFGEVQIVDWGLAKVLGQGGVADEARAVKRRAEVTIVTTVRTKAVGSESRVGSVMGTPAYMSPEQARGQVEDIDETGDVFALGAILCEILTGLPPYTGEGDSILVQAAEHKIGDARTRMARCGADPALVKLALKCLAAEKADRFRDAGALAKAVHAHFVAIEDRAHRAELAATEAGLRVVHLRKSRLLTLALAASVVLAMLVGGAAFWHAQGEKLRREEQAAGPVRKTLEEAAIARGRALGAALGDLAPWKEAIAASARAVDLAQGGGADRETVKRAEGFLADVKTEEGKAREAAARAEKEHRAIERLVDARLMRGEEFDGARREAAFKAAMADLGVVVGTTAEERAVEILRGSPAIREIVAALDEWGATNKQAATLARNLDTDASRSRIRELESKDDARGLAALLKEDEFQRSPPETFLLLADALGRQDDPAGAVAAAREAFKREPAGFWSNAVLGWWLIRLEKPERDEAARLLRAAATARPEGAGIHYHLGLLLDAAGDLDGGIAALRETYRLDKDYGKVKAKLADALMRKAGGLTLGAAWKGALDNFKDAVALDPENEMIHLGMSVMYWYLDDRPACIASSREVLRINPQNKAVQLQLAGMLFGTGKREEAITYIRGLLKEDPSNVALMSLLRSHLIFAGDLDGAIELAKKLQMQFPMDTNQMAILAYLHSRRGEWKESLELRRKVVTLEPTQFWFRYSLGHALWLSGDREGAIAVWKEYQAMSRSLLEKAPGNIGYIDNLCQSLFLVDAAELRDMLEARRLAERMTALQPTSARAWSMLSSVNYRSGDFVGAEKAVDKALALTSKGSEKVPQTLMDRALYYLHLRKSMILWKLDRKDEALTYYARACRVQQEVGLIQEVDREQFDEAAELMGPPPK